jgi:hypothetical protein
MAREPGQAAEGGGRTEARAGDGVESANQIVRAQRFRKQCETVRISQVDGEAPEIGPVLIHHLLCNCKGRRTNAADRGAQVMS